MADAAGPARHVQRLAAAQPEPLERLMRRQRGGGSAAASSKEIPSGMCARKPSGTVVNSA